MDVLVEGRAWNEWGGLLGYDSAARQRNEEQQTTEGRGTHGGGMYTMHRAQASSEACKLVRPLYHIADLMMILDGNTKAESLENLRPAQLSMMKRL